MLLTFRSVLALLAAIGALLLAGCLGADEPLLPSGRFVAVTPVKPGYYLMRQVVRGTPDMNGLSADAEPHQLWLRQTTYTLQEGGFSAGNRLEGQVFGSPDSNGVYVVQSYRRKLLTTPGRWLYTRLDVEGGTFALHRRDCRSLARAVRDALVETGAVMRVEQGDCLLASANAALTATTIAEFWRQANFDLFTPVPPSQVTSLDTHDNAPLVDPLCDGAPVNQHLGPGFGAQASSTDGPHLRVIAASDRPNASVEVALAVEAKGDRIGRWAWLTLWDESAAKASCKPQKLFRILAFRPAASVIDAGVRSADFDERCKRLSAQRCDHSDAMIQAYQQAGLKILVQGREALRFPDGKITMGDVITAMSSEGASRRIVVLTTLGNGATVLSQDIRA